MANRGGREPDFIAFSDESGTSEQHRSIAVATCSYANYRTHIHRDLAKLIQDFGIKEFKWQHVRTSEYVPIAKKLVEFTLEHVCKRDLRVDVLIWDTHDSRHAVKKRDDPANFERMFYHLLGNVMRKRKTGATWRIYPDKGMPVNWQNIQDCLANRGKKCALSNTLYGRFLDDRGYTIELLKEAESHEAPLCQLADLFAGMGVFSVHRYAEYCDWQATSAAAQHLLAGLNVKPLTHSERARFPVIDYLYCGCKQRRLGVSFSSKQRLFTPQPSNPINFWPYEPQGDYDKAPQKENRNSKGFTSSDQPKP